MSHEFFFLAAVESVCRLVMSQLFTELESCMDLESWQITFRPVILVQLMTCLIMAEWLGVSIICPLTEKVIKVKVNVDLYSALS